MSHRLDIMAKRIFMEAIRQDRAGELLEHLFDGGGVTFDPFEHGLVLIPKEVIQDLADGDDG